MPLKKLIKNTKKDNSVSTPLLNKREASDQKIPLRKSNNNDNNNSGALPAREARGWTEPHS